VPQLCDARLGEGEDMRDYLECGEEEGCTGKESQW